jgi:hypothetical protein
LHHFNVCVVINSPSGFLFEEAVEETDELLDGKVAVRAEVVEFNKDMDERRR